MYLLETVLPTMRENMAEIVVLVVTLASRDLIAWLRSKKAKLNIKETLETILKDLAFCKSELTTNGGHTTKDITLKTHAKVEQQTAQIDDLHIQMKDLKAQQRARFEQQLNESVECILLFDELGKCTFANESAQSMFGKGSSNFVGSNWFGFIKDQHEREKMKTSWDFSITNRIEFTDEFTIRGRLSLQKVTMNAKHAYADNGKFLWIIAKIKPI